MVTIALSLSPKAWTLCLSGHFVSVKLHCSMCAYVLIREHVLWKPIVHVPGPVCFLKFSMRGPDVLLIKSIKETWGPNYLTYLI